MRLIHQIKRSLKANMLLSAYKYPLAEIHAGDFVLLLGAAACNGATAGHQADCQRI